VQSVQDADARLVTGLGRRYNIIHVLENSSQNVLKLTYSNVVFKTVSGVIHLDPGSRGGKGAGIFPAVKLKRWQPYSRLIAVLQVSSSWEDFASGSSQLLPLQ